MLFFSCAALLWGLSGPLSAIFGKQDTNTTVTIYNLFVLMSAILYFSGAAGWSRQKDIVKFPGLWITVSFSVTISLIALIIIFSTRGITPAFFIEDTGGTRLRYYILGVSIILLLATAIMLSISSKDLNLNSFYWYSIALGLISIGILGVMIMERAGDILNWTGRSAQFLGGAYMTIAAFTLAKETHIWEIATQVDLNSKRKLAENALRNKEERYLQLFELAGEAIIITDEKYFITEWNSAAQALYGWSANEVIGKNSQEILRSNIQEAELQKLLKNLTDKGVIFYETVQHKKDNSQIIIEARLSVIKEDNGTISGFIAMNRDITERKKAEQQLRNDEERFRIMGQRLNIALENANIGLWEVDFVKDEVIWDERTELMFGLAPGSFTRTIEAFEEMVLEEDLPRVRMAFKNSIEKGTNYESVFRLRSLHSKYLSSRAIVVKNKDGKAQRMMGVCFDVTAFREDSDKAILRLNEELSRSNKDLESFAYIASHDLQEPLRMVSSFTQLLQKRYADKLDEDANTFINYAVEGSQRMYELLNGLLKYSRIRTRGAEFVSVDMNNVVQKVKANLKIRLEESQAEIISGDLPVVKADENQMIQIIQNLVDNAIKFTGNKPVITISSVKENGSSIFSVRDEGIGIEPQYYERIFRIFQRLHPKDQYGGMGLGLSICQRIVERHGGKIWVESEPAKGSTFSFSIPENSI